MQNQFVDLYRNGVKTAADAATYSLEKAVELQERQLGILRTIVDENKRSVDSIAEAKSLEDLLSLQSRFARSQLERTAEIWSNFVQAAAEQQKAWIDRMQSQVGQTRDRVRDTYDLTSRTSEEIARTAASQVSRTRSLVWPICDCMRSIHAFCCSAAAWMKFDQISAERSSCARAKRDCSDSRSSRLFASAKLSTERLFSSTIVRRMPSCRSWSSTAFSSE